MYIYKYSQHVGIYVYVNAVILKARFDFDHVLLAIADPPWERGESGL